MANEKRLIDANELESRLVCESEFRKSIMNCFGALVIDEIIANDLANSPTVDAVEVVRCKDCKHYDRLFKGEGVINKIGTCYLRKEEGIEIAQRCDDFCSYGERREGE